MDMANFAFADYLARKGSVVNLVTHRALRSLASRPEVKVHSVPKPLNSYLLGEPLLSRRGFALASQVAARGGRVVVNGGNCKWHDVSWVHYVHAAYSPTVNSRTHYRLKTMYSHRRALKAEQAALKNASLVLCNSERTRRDVIEFLGVEESRTRTVYYGIDSDLYAPPAPSQKKEAREKLKLSSGKPLAAFVGALGDRRKGFDSLFAAWKALCKDREWDCDLVVVGSGAELESWKTLSQECGIGDRIKFMGFRPDVDKILSVCDVLIHPARYEAYGLGVREALCLGLPAIVSSSAGVAEHYTGELRRLLIADPEDIEMLKERLWNWRQNIEGVRGEVAPLSARLRGRTWDVMAEELVRHIEAN